MCNAQSRGMGESGAQRRDARQLALVTRSATCFVTAGTHWMALPISLNATPGPHTAMALSSDSLVTCGGKQGVRRGCEGGTKGVRRGS
eukprot:623822-Prorocentrum_minimum.AAC.1